MDLSRVVTGIVFFVLGMIMLFVFIKANFEVWVLLIYGIVLFVFGVLIVFDFGKEKEIEEIKQKYKKGKR
jgi:membrane-bound ClpP family serine protease